MAMRFADLSIRRKLVLTTLASTAVALVLAAGGFFAWDIDQYRREIERDLLAEARTIAENSTASLAFSDPRAAGETLAVLEIHPNIRLACMYTASGELFATYFRDTIDTCPAAPGESFDITWRSARLTTPIMLEGRRVGRLVVERDLTDVTDRAAVGGVILAALFVLATVLAGLLGVRMQRIVADPLLQLADTARRVSESKDYSLRAKARSNDEVGTVIHAFNDMLERVQARTNELSRANRLKDEFLATLSHELRTPLNAVLGWVRILRSTPNAPPGMQARALETIERNARLQARLIEDLLEVSRIVSGKLHLRTRAVDLSGIVESAVDVVQPAATAKNIRLETEIEACPCMTTGDADRLQQVVWNLLSNAVKFTPPGGKVMLRLVHDHDYVLTVSDTGIGIDPAFVPQIFQPFRQADASPSREQGGLGLGLAIVRHLVELHGGTVSARSPGKGLGTTFEVRLPAVSPAAWPQRETRPEAVASAPEPAHPDVLAGIDVLVVDDEDDARELVRTVLENYGATVTCAASAVEAIRALDRRVPDVVISDIAMAGEDGYSLVRRIRARPTAAGGGVPAIALTAYASASDHKKALEAGYDAHVAKPFEPSAIASLVRKLTGTRVGT
jgi:signal transduction histidine kinase/CheY-like chemotaxis protein